MRMAMRVAMAVTVRVIMSVAVIMTVMSVVMRSKGKDAQQIDHQPQSTDNKKVEQSLRLATFQ